MYCSVVSCLIDEHLNVYCVVVYFTNFMRLVLCRLGKGMMLISSDEYCRYAAPRLSAKSVYTR